MREHYANHVARLATEIAAALENNGYDAIVIAAGHESPVSRFDDRFWTFNPTPAYAHVCPVAEPGAAVVLTAGRFALYRPAHTSYWEAPPASPPDWAIAPFEEADPSKPPTGRVAFVGEAEADAAIWGIAEDDINPASLLVSLDAIRAIKSAYEVACIAEANAIATRGHQAIASEFFSGDYSELSLHLHYLRATDQDDVETPYKGIVALGRNAAVLHHNRYGKAPQGQRGLSLLVDAGAEVRGYAADVTRTHVKGSTPASRRFGELVAAVDQMQQDICSRIKVGLSFEVLHDQTHQLLAGLVRDFGLTTASSDELIDSGVTRALLPHGLGHSIGIQVHDVGCKIKPPAVRNPFLRNTADVAEGHAFTIEPGCYFIDSLIGPLRGEPVAKRLNWPLIDEMEPFGGIRIEDNIAIVDGETRNLTRDNWPSPP